VGEVLSGRPVDNVNLREDAVIGRVDKWLAREFVPHRMSDTLSALAEAPLRDTTTTSASDGEAASKIAECDRKLAQYRAALDAGANPATVAGWIAETEAEKASFALGMRRPEARPRMTQQEIRSIVDKFADIAHVLMDADLDDKAETEFPLNGSA
jgi:site-specific DNA recombinase